MEKRGTLLGVPFFMLHILLLTTFGTQNYSPTNRFQTHMSDSKRKQKRIFLIVSILFVAVVIGFSIDIASRTTFPGSKPNLQERIIGSEEGEQNPKANSTEQDSVASTNE